MTDSEKIEYYRDSIKKHLKLEDTDDLYYKLSVFFNKVLAISKIEDKALFTVMPHDLANIINVALGTSVKFAKGDDSWLQGEDRKAYEKMVMDVYLRSGQV